MEVPSLPGIRYRIVKAEGVDGSFSDTGIEIDGDGQIHHIYFDAETAHQVYRTIITLP